jgi:hypothetical protein
MIVIFSNIKIIKCVGFVISTAIIFYWIFGEPLFFRKHGKHEIAEFSRNNRTYFIEKHVDDSGSGQYTIYTLSKVENNRTIKIEEFTTCGRIKLESNRIIFFRPELYHCGLLTAPLNDIFNPNTSILEFTQDGERLLESR